MTPEQKRDQLTDAHAAVFAGLLESTDGLDVTGWATPTGCPGWDVHDQLAHTVGVERRMLGESPPDVEVPDSSYLRNDFGREVERDVQARRGVPAGELRAEAREVFDRRLAALRELDPAALDEPMDGPIGQHMRTAQMLRTRIFDLTCHEQDIRRAVRRLDGWAGPHVAIAVELVLRAWARLVPDRLSDSRRLGVAVDGHEAVAVDLGDGQLLRGADALAETAATFHVDAAGLLALGAGRTDAPPLDALRVEGDVDLVGEFREVAGITP